MLRLLFLGLALLLATACGGGSGSPPPPREDPYALTPNSVDFAADPVRLAASLRLQDRTFEADDCEVVDGMIAQPGLRRLLLFDTRIINYGELDAIVGDPANPEPPVSSADFVYSVCRDRYQMQGYARHRLYDMADQLVAEGHKQSFCLVDSDREVPLAPASGYDCDYQGISSGWADIYFWFTPGQWVDVTGIPAGTYRLRVTVNADGAVPEVDDRRSNTAEVMVTLPDPMDPPVLP